MTPFRIAASLVASALLALTLSACATQAPQAQMPTITYSHKTPIVMAAGSIRFEEVYVPPLKQPNVEHTFNTNPARVARAWAAQRLQAGGGEGEIVVRLVKGSVIAEDMDRDIGLSGFFKDQQDTRYVADVEVEVVYQGGSGQLGKTVARGSVRASQTTLESSSINEREEAYFSLMRLVSEELDKVLETQVRTHMAWLIRN